MPELIKFSYNSAQDGLGIACLKTVPDNDVRGVLIFAHGMSEHKERYIPVMEYLSSHGYVCAINDHRGHGESVKSDDDLGYFYDNGAVSVVEDTHQLMEIVRTNYPDTPVYLLGHSMGSLVVRTFTKKYDSNINGLIVSGSPSANSAAGVAKFMIRVSELFHGDKYRSNFLNTLVNGSFNKDYKDSGHEFAWLSRNIENVEKYEADKYCGFVFTNNGFYSLMNLMVSTYDRKGWAVNNPELPIYFISGEEDPCMVDKNKFDSAVEFMKSVGYKNVDSKLYENMRHEIMNESGKEIVWDDILEHMNSWN